MTSTALFNGIAFPLIGILSSSNNLQFFNLHHSWCHHMLSMFQVLIKYLWYFVVITEDSLMDSLMFWLLKSKYWRQWSSCHFWLTKQLREERGEVASIRVHSHRRNVFLKEVIYKVTTTTNSEAHVGGSVDIFFIGLKVHLKRKLSWQPRFKRKKKHS